MSEKKDCLNIVYSRDYTASFETKAVVLYFYFHLEKCISYLLWSLVNFVILIASN